ncbi:hypothetical protein G6F60_013914 [Rhizopus arrhizus]|nr:hypothetical protein G6F60_013914 [Rhizopus arrhizus]
MALRQEKNVGDCTGRFCSSSAHSISRAMSSGTWLAMSAINAYRRGSDAARLVMAKPSLAPGGSRDPHAPPAIEGSRCILFAAIKIATSSSLFLYSRRQSRPRRAALARRSSIRLKTWQSRHPAQVPSNVPSMKADVPSMRCAAAHDGRSLGSLPSHLALEPRHAARPHRSSQR